MDDLPEDSIYRELPEIEDAEYIVSAFHGCGMVSSNGMGLSAISWLELSAYCSMTINYLTGWESETVIDMSRAYASNYRKAEDPLMIAPFTVDEDLDAMEFQRGIVRKQLAEMKEQRKNIKMKK